MDSLKRLQDLFAQFPTVGRRTAGRFVYYLIHQPQQTTDELIAAINELKKSITLCKLCFNPFEPALRSRGEDGCGICTDPTRNKQQLCVVEKEADLNTIENAKRYQGLYFILGGTLPHPLRLTQLQQRIETGAFAEVIIAINPTPDGKATAVLVEQKLKETIRPGSGPTVTRLAQGLPVGGELEYADEETLESAFSGRR